MIFGSPEEPRMSGKEKLKIFVGVHWRGVCCVFIPLFSLLIILPPPTLPHHWCAFCLVIMACFWVTECIPLPVTSFLPVILFPLTGVNSTSATCAAYISDSLMMFLGSLILAACVEQSGLHVRLAYFAVRTIGFTHMRLLLSMSLVTMFVSMWITNTAAVTMMVPINFAVLKVFEEQKLMKIFEYTSEGERVASDLTTCYFCATTYSATIGGIGTLVGTATNLVMKGLLVKAYPKVPEYLSFPKFSAFTVPMMIFLEAATFFSMVILFLGWLRPNSAAAKQALVTPQGQAAAKAAVDANWDKLGSITFWEYMVILLFGGSMIFFFCRSPQMFLGWGDILEETFHRPAKFIRDSALAGLVGFLMFVSPSNLSFFKNFTVKYYEQLPKVRASSVLDWKKMDASLPYSFMFLLGGGFALSDAAKKSGLNQKIGESMAMLKVCPNAVVLFLIILAVTFVTNFASNVAVCNVFVPLAMELAKQIHRNPMWYNLAGGISASYCFMLPVGTPGNLVVQSAASIPTSKMMVAGAVPTVATILLTWFFLFFWAPVVWPDLTTLPPWA
ncbi:PREDICTED: protein I'm not dead yet-like [Papilio polytes]|uniref:protein I'm not dead yet-like n=1 Tax=Papilio polytes TaxID=76194 RepID=UPI000675DF8E|nr:PREDICTED: protein I'm not dead yet-like [Papilio polytes]